MIHTTSSQITLLGSLTEADRMAIIRKLSREQVRNLPYSWRSWARPGQLPPGTIGALNARTDWVHWLPLAGRGWGKTKVGAETVRLWAEDPKKIINIVGPTTDAVRKVMIEGPSGLLSCYPPWARPQWEPTRHRVTFPSGAVAHTFSADEPERLRGPQCTNYWADEPCAWRFLVEAWDNLMFGFRLGDNPQGVITTTPKPIKWLKEMVADSGCVVTRHSSLENKINLTKVFFDKVIGKYIGTRIGRQEVEAEILDDTPGALWKRQKIDELRITAREVQWSMVLRVVIGVDPAVTSGEDSNETGIVAAALTRSGHVLVLDDQSCRESPAGWANVVTALYRRRRADRVVGEVNNGGDLVERNIRVAEPNISYRSVRASRGKLRRAEPVAQLYERGLVHHVGFFSDLEDQLCTYVPGIGEDESPDRMDAMVWAITELAVDPEPVEAGVQFASWSRISPV